MECTCVRHTELPHTSPFLADLLYHPDRTARFIRHPQRDLESFRGAAAEVRFSEGQRAVLVRALAEQNAGSAALERMARPGTLAVATGQQVGLFSGPAYTVYKALHAARLASWLTANGLPAVPVFWLATEDHDFAEVNHAWVFDAEHRPVKLELHRSAGAQPVGSVVVGDAPLGELRSALAGMPFSDETVSRVEQAYQAGNTMGGAFGELLRGLLSEFDILQVDPMLPAFRELAAPVMRKAVESGAELGAAVLERNRELAAAGYHAQVHVEEQTSLVFLLEDGRRQALRRHGSDFVLNGRRFTNGELAGRAVSLSPNALLRPVVQDSILPTVATIGGPAEMAYLAQSEVLYRGVLGRMPVPVPRAGFTLLDERSRKLMERYGLALHDFFQGEEALRERISATLVPEALTASLEHAVAAVNSELERLGRDLSGFDPTLGKALGTSGRKIRYQLAKLRRKTGREALRRNERAAREAASLYGLVYPERALQERLYSILPFVARHGPDVLRLIYDAIEPECVDHRLMVI